MTVPPLPYDHSSLRHFIGQRGNGLTTKGVADIVRKYAYHAGLQDVSLHTLRHSYGKHALDAGVDLVAVSTLLGHLCLETTAIYATPSGRDLEKAVSKLERDQLEATSSPDLARRCWLSGTNSWLPAPCFWPGHGSVLWPSA